MKEEREMVKSVRLARDIPRTRGALVAACGSSSDDKSSGSSASKSSASR